MDEYFKESDEDGLPNRFDADQYRPPYLMQAIQREEANALSSVSDGYSRQAEQAAANSLGTLAANMGSGQVPIGADLKEVMSAFAASLPRAGEDQSGYLIANPSSYVRRMCVGTPELQSLPDVERPTYAAGESQGRKHVVVDVPPMGFAWVSVGKTGSGSQKPLVEEGVLRNEFFEIRFDETTGAMRSLHDYANRGNRLSQQLALKMPTKRGGDEGPGYSVMAADSMDVTLSDAAVGEITTKGRLLDLEGRELASFAQRYRAVRGSRVLQIDIELEPQQIPRADPWNSYYACRFAWADESANFYRDVGGVRESTTAKRLEAPLYFEIDLPKQRTAILAGGLPYHRRIGARRLDSLLIVRGEQKRRFRLGVGIDLSHPLQEALSFLAPTTAEFARTAPPGGPSSSWLFHIDSKNVVATHWEPLFEDGSAAGLRVRLLEGYGRPAKVTLSAFRAVESARRTDYLGEPLEDCDVEEDKVRFEMAPREWTQLELRF